jgi:hypothetical protein
MNCKDCRADTHMGSINYYTVHDAVWQEADGGDGELCLMCLAKRLGRHLVLADFVPCPASIAAGMCVTSDYLVEAEIWGCGDFAALSAELAEFLSSCRWCVAWSTTPSRPG